MINTDSVFDVIASACQLHHSQGYLTKEHENLISQVSDIILSAHGKIFRDDILFEERCMFLLANKSHFQLYVDSINNPELKKFSLEDLQEVALSDSVDRSALVDEMLARENIPFYKREQTKKALMALTAIGVVAGSYYLGIAPLNNYVVNSTSNIASNIATNYLLNPLHYMWTQYGWYV